MGRSGVVAMLLTAGWAPAALAQPPDPVVVHYEAGLAAKQAKDYVAAVAELAEALRLNPDHLDSHWVLAWVYIATKHDDLAAAQFKEVMRLAGDSEKGRQARETFARLKPEEAAIVVPEEGQWEGEFEGCTMRFLVDERGTVIRWINASEARLGEDGKPDDAFTSDGGPAPIRGGRFSLRFSLTKGAFTTPTSAEGTLQSRITKAERAWKAEFREKLRRAPQPLTRGDHLLLAVERGDLAEARRLVDTDPSCLQATNHPGESALHIAVACAAPDMVRFLLDANAARDRIRGLGGQSVIHYAVQRGDSGILRSLLEAGIDPDLGGDTFDSPLTLAARLGRYDCAKALLEHGAEPDGAARPGQTPLFEAKQRGYDSLVRLLREAGGWEYRGGNKSRPKPPSDG